jgi:hypothetical protein
MKIRLGELRRIIREAAEAAQLNTDELAAMLTENDGGAKVVVYHPVPIENMMRKLPGDVVDRSPELMAKLKEYMVGWVQVVKPKDPCWDAMMIASIAGPGKLMYGIAYALSPSGLLISDRDSMTDVAVSAWRNMSTKGNRDKKKLDNVSEPATPEPNDDCVLRPEEFLNYAYGAEGWEMGVLETMHDNHEVMIARATKGGILTREEVEKVLTEAGLSYWRTRYRAAWR